MKKSEMRATIICISLPTAGANIYLSSKYGIINFLTEHGYNYKEALLVDEWAKSAHSGEKYNLHDAEIYVE